MHGKIIKFKGDISDFKENASLQDLKDKEHDIKHLNLTYDRVVF